MKEFYQKAKLLSEDFLNNQQQYRLGFVEAEQINPITKTLGEDYIEDTKKGITTLLKADQKLADIFADIIKGEEFDVFTDRVYYSLINGGRIFISGCGATGRLAIRLEASWRKRMKGTNLENSVVSVMTGGDFALIRAVESFEDYIQLGENQIKDFLPKENDTLIGVTATGETTSILGTAIGALDCNAFVYMVVCTNPSTIVDRLERANIVYNNKNCKSLYISCGGMAVTGSTRMQSTSIEQAVIACALELSLKRICGEKEDKNKLINGFNSALNAVKSSVDSLYENTEKEHEIYKKDGYVTYFADEYLLDVLADTTERAPTFSTPPFRPNKRTDLPLSPAFVKNPFYDTETAWEKCLQRIPRCFEKDREYYLSLGLKSEDVSKIPDISRSALYDFMIGNEDDAQREKGESLAMWIDSDAPPKEFLYNSQKYKKYSSLILNTKDIVKTETMIFEHLAMKMFINILSTGVMAKMGKIYGNYMINLSISNKKLVDRATRIIADLCNLSYENANYELFLSSLILKERNENLSPVKFTIDRLKRGCKKTDFPFDGELIDSPNLGSL